MRLTPCLISGSIMTIIPNPLPTTMSYFCGALSGPHSDCILDAQEFYPIYIVLILCTPLWGRPGVMGDQKNLPPYPLVHNNLGSDHVIIQIEYTVDPTVQSI